MVNINNKRGDAGDQLTIFAFLFLLVLVGVGIVGGVFLFFGKGYEFRQVEAEILNYKLENCIFEEGIDSISENFFDKCGLNENILDEDFIIKICKNSNDCFKEEGEINIGKLEECYLEGIKNKESSSKCVLKRFRDGENVIDLVTGSNQNLRRKLS